MDSADRYATLPGNELLEVGLADLHAGRASVEGLLLLTATERLSRVGVIVPGGPSDDATRRLFDLVVERVGTSRAHGRYNALRRRLYSFLAAAAILDARHR